MIQRMGKLDLEFIVIHMLCTFKFDRIVHAYDDVYCVL